MRGESTADTSLMAVMRHTTLGAVAKCMFDTSPGIIARLEKALDESEYH